MSAEHKAALAAGRAEGRAIREYLEALQSSRPRPGRKRTPDSIKKRLAKIDEELETADTMRRLHLTQERIDLERELEAADTKVDIAALEKAFVKVAPSYSTRKKISYAAWREMGVPAATLKAAGISRAKS